jgi:carboxymethylenebutenolidase
MLSNGKVFDKIIYPNANDAFYDDTSANWNEAAAADAWTRTLAWFDKYLIATPGVMPAAPKGKM